MHDATGPMTAMTLQMWLENLAAYSLQVMILIAAGTALVSIFRVRAPNVLLAFWQSLLMVCLLLPLFQPWRSVPHGTSIAAVPAVKENSVALPEVIAPIVVTPARFRQTLIPVYPTIAAILGAGVALRLLWLALGLLRLHHYRDKSRMLSSLPESVRDMQWRVGVSPGIFLSDEIDTPVTFGLRQPIVLFPVAFTDMDEILQRPIACHELLHVRRRDWLHIVLEETLRSLFWFHPAVWWALGKVHLSREQVVDREVLKVTGERGPYLESLLHIASLRGRPAAVPAPLLLKERHLIQRVTLMLKESAMTKSRLIFSLVAIIAVLLWTGTLAAGLFPLTSAPGPASQDHSMIGTSTTSPAQETPSPNPATGSAIDSSPRISANALPRTAAKAKQASGAEQVQQGQPRLLRKVIPAYPELARRARIEATVVLDVTINEQGVVSDAHALQGHPLLNQTCIDAIKQWVYEPTYENGRAVPVRTTVTVVFQLAGSRSEQPAAVVPIGPSTPRESGELVVVTAGIPDTGFVAPTTVPKQIPANASTVAQVPKVEPLRVGGNVQESKLIRRVEPIYPELAIRARVEFAEMLEVTVNEQGDVTNVKVLHGHPLLDEAAIEAVKQWQYSPTYLNGQAVQVVATVTVPFTLGAGTLRLSMDPDGSLRNLAGGSMASIDTLRGSNGSIIISVPPQLPFALVNEVLANLRSLGIHNIVLQGNYLVGPDGGLFYGPGAVRGGDRIEAPNLNIDPTELMAIVRSVQVPGNVQVLSYYVYVTETGQVAGVERREGLEIPQVETALQRVQVLSPGRFGNEPVPAVFMFRLMWK
jgi:TonB family protein